MNAKFTLTTFTPGEVERITGLSTAMQRDWRRRSLLRSQEGHARFDAFELAEAWVMKLGSDRGIGPQSIRAVAPWCASAIVWEAMAWCDAFEGDTADVLSWAPPPPPATVPTNVRDLLVRSIEAAGLDIDGETADKWADRLSTAGGDGWDWGSKADWLRRRLWDQLGLSRVRPARFFIWWATGTEVWTDSLDRAFGGLSNDPRYVGPVIVVDQHAIGSELIDRVGRPLVHVELPRDEAGSIVEPDIPKRPAPLAERLAKD